MNIFLETHRLVITVPTLDDFENLYALQSDEEVMQYIGQGVRTKEEVMAGLKKAIAHKDKHGFSLGAVFEKNSGLFVGRAGLIHLAYDDTQPDIEVGYALIKSAWGKGYATEVAKALVAWGFEHLSINKLVGVVHPQNERSAHVLEKTNMYYVGRAHYWGQEVRCYAINKPQIDYNQIELVAATLKDYPVIQNMGRFYVYDMSRYFATEKEWAIPADGLYECIDFKKYWADNDSFPFLLSYQNELVGFAIVDKKGSHSGIDFNMAQFFILQKFKNQGIGRYVAEQCFKKFPGTWEVMVIPGNEGAYRFWRSTIKKYTNNHFTEYTKAIAHFNQNRKNIFAFNSQ